MSYNKQRNKIIAIALVLVCSPTVMAQSKPDKRLIADAEYRTFLNELESRLSLWETTIAKIDPASTSDPQRFVHDREGAVVEARWIRVTIPSEKRHRRVSLELKLKRYVEGFSYQFDRILPLAPRASKSNLQLLLIEIAKCVAKLSNDVQARVELLEKRSCP